MSIRSMTGFGRADFTTPHGPVRIEIKSTNLKFFELSSRLPDDLVPFAEPIRKHIQGRVKRGKVVLTVTAPDTLLTPGEVHLNEDLAVQYHRALVRLNRVLGTNEKITLSHIARLPDVMTRSVTKKDIRYIWEKSRAAIDRAITAFEASRLKEGRALMKDMEQRALRIRTRLTLIENRVPKVVQLHKQKVEKRLGDPSGDPAAREKLSAETAAFAKSCDITEEIVRLKSHIDSFRKTMKEDGETGRKIDFIGQEMMRETNTIGAKSNDFAISDHVIHIKAELEKIREQAQNVE